LLFLSESKKPKNLYSIMLKIFLYSCHNFKTILKFFIPVIVLMNFKVSVAQSDTIHLHTGQRITGKFLEMKRNLVIFETDFTENDSEIKWDNIDKLKTTTRFLVTVNSGERYTGHLESVNDSIVRVVSENGEISSTPKNTIVHIRQIELKFWSRFNASLSVGYNFTKANNLSQYSVRSNLGYKAKRWLAFARYNQIISTQDDIDRTQRLDANFVYNHFLSNNWFVLGEANWLSNTAQNIDLRTLGKFGLGKYLKQTNSLYWGIQTGISFNNESFNTDLGKVTNNSTEAFFGTEVNLYDVGDINLLSRLVVYPSMTQSGRWRSDFNFDIKYDLPLDFYINLGVSLNYDNQPIDTGVETDYIFQTTVGWSL